LCFEGRVRGISKKSFCGKKAIKSLAELAHQAHCREAFSQLRILTVPNLYILESVCYVKKKINEAIEIRNRDRHSYNTRKKQVFHSNID
jgi:hypothetical protein